MGGPKISRGYEQLNTAVSIYSRALVAWALCMLIATPAVAGRYELINGQGVEVCEAYEQNLNYGEPRGPFQGQRPVNPGSKDFSKPDLKGSYEDPSPENPRSYPEKKIDRFLWERDANPVYWYRGGIAKWRGTTEQYAQAWKLFSMRYAPGHMVASQGHKVGQVDIDNDGVPDNIYLNQWGAGAGASLLVLNADRSDLDYEKTRLVMQHPSRKEQGLGDLRKLAPGERATAEAEQFGWTPVEDALRGANYDVFLYKNKAYFDLWWYSHPDYQGKLDLLVGKPLRVFVIENGQTRNICSYKYHHSD